MNPSTAVVFGAGKMAGGLLGQVLAQSGLNTLFVARRPEVVEAINRRGGYSLCMAEETMRRIAIRNCAALSIQDHDRVAQAVSEAGVVFTAVGIDNLSAITPAIAEGVWRRSQNHLARPLNVIACENLPGAGAYLGHQVTSAARLEHAVHIEKSGGYSAALTRRIMTGGDVQEGELTFTANADYDLIIDRSGLKGELPGLTGAEFTDEFAAMVMRKLFLLNCGQAVAAYAGYRFGCRFVHEAAVHPDIAPVLLGAVAEAQAALTAEFPNQAEAIDRDAQEALARIADPRLADMVSRVARGPRRKLSARERLVGPARLAGQHNLPNEHLCAGIAAALAYDDHEDPQAVAMQQAIAISGVEKILTEDCGLLPHDDLARAVKERWARCVAGKARSHHRSPALQVVASLDAIVQNVTRDLAQRYDPALVGDVVTHVARQFGEARVWNYVPIFVKRRAEERLRCTPQGHGKRVCFLLERGSPPRTNPILADVFARLEARGVHVTALYPEEEAVRLDTLTVEADVYFLKSDTEMSFSLAMALQSIGARVVNDCRASALAKDKTLAAAILHKAGLPAPPSRMAAQPFQLAPMLAEGPVIFKPYRGYHGAGITVANTSADLPSAALYPDIVFAQDYLANARLDLKVFVVGDEVFGVRKAFSTDSFLHAGAPVALSPRVEDLARRCGQAFGLELYGLDIAETDEGEAIIDVNTFPGYRGVPDAAQRLEEYILRIVAAGR
jgi:mannitol-1-phosphate 5-dehydrogenase